MARTTLDIDTPVLQEIKRLCQRKRARAAVASPGGVPGGGPSLGRLVSDLLAEALARRRRSAPRPPPFEWKARDLRPRVDFDDKEALWAILGAEDAKRLR